MPNVRLFYSGNGRQTGTGIDGFGEYGDIINGNVSGGIRNGSARGHRQVVREGGRGGRGERKREREIEQGRAWIPVVLFATKNPRPNMVDNDE